MRFSLGARGCQTPVWTLHYVHWRDRHCVNKMNNKPVVLWASIKENNELVSVLDPRRLGSFRLLSNRLLPDGWEAVHEDTSNFPCSLHPAGKPRLATSEAGANLIRMFSFNFWCGLMSGLRRKKGFYECHNSNWNCLCGCLYHWANTSFNPGTLVYDRCRVF